VITPLRWEGGVLHMLDQRLLPAEERWLPMESAEEAAAGIRDMAVRGAPAIGLAAAYGMALAARREPSDGALEEAARLLAASRPTAVNLFWALDRCLECWRGLPPAERPPALEELALRLHREDVEACRAMGRHGVPYIPPGAVVLTHCNAGALATGGYGTALGVIRAAHEAGKAITVLADETRPYLQGARLTAWELDRDGIPVQLLTDGMAGHLMARGEIQAVVVGADRIAADGDTANKIGTYTLAVLARRHGIPFLVAAPLSTVDFRCPSGEAIPIEERPGEEAALLFGRRLCPEGVGYRHPAFDVTPAELITAVITERGTADPPGPATLAALRP